MSGLTRTFPSIVARRVSSSKRAAFTLVELVVSILLMAALLTATWTMLNSFRDRFEKSQSRVERSQLIRALHQVLENDLASCLVTRSRRPSSAENPSGGLFAPLSRERLAQATQQRSEADSADGRSSTVGSRPLGQPLPLGATDRVTPSERMGESTTEATPSIDAVSDDASRQASELDGGGETQGLSLGLQSETDRVAQNEWLAQDTRFFGTSTALVCDLVVPAELPERMANPLDARLGDDALSAGGGIDVASRSVPASGAATSLASNATGALAGRGMATDTSMSVGSGFGQLAGGETAEIPEVTRRVVYLFTDPDTGARAGRPAGLIRCELTNRQITSIRLTASDRMDLFVLLQPVLGTPLLPGSPDTSTPTENGLGAEGMQGNNTTGLPAAGSFNASGNLAGARADDTMSSGADVAGQLNALANPAPSMQADHLPEIVSFRLRYFDGESWQSSWDSRERRELPVAVEMRFRLAEPMSTELTNAESGMAAESVGDASVSAGGGGMEAADASASEEARLEAMSADSSVSDDPRRMSSQTRPVEDHRYVVLLSSPPMLRSSERGEETLQEVDAASDAESEGSAENVGGGDENAREGGRR